MPILPFNECHWPEQGPVSVLGQLRAGYHSRPRQFPHSVVLCGVQRVRAYPGGSGGSPFNNVADSLRLRDFSREEVADLVAQHTRETGQEFSPRALDLLWTQTRGQPWLVFGCGIQDSRKTRPVLPLAGSGRPSAVSACRYSAGVAQADCS